MNLESLIRSTLYGKETVVVPGLGTFNLQYQSARLVKSEKVTFKPPQKTVVYSQECDSSNTVLVDAFAQILNCSKDEALQKINDFVSKFKILIQQKGSASLCGVGTFSADGTFKSATFPESSPETFGLGDFSIKTLSEDEKKNDKPNSLKVAVGVAKTMFIASPILFGALLIPNILQVSHNVHFASLFRETNVAVDLSEPEMPRPYAFKTVVKEETQAPVEKVAMAEVKKAKPVAQKKKSTQKTKNLRYFVVVGTFSDVSNAERYVQKLKSENPDSGVITPENEKSKVYLTAFSEKSEAQSYMKQLRENSEYSKAWVYVKKS